MNLKKDFPIFENNKKLVYLDSAATSQKPAQVIESIKKFYENDNANASRGVYSLSERATEKFEKSRKVVADFINADENEIVFTKNTTESVNLVSYSIENLILNGKDEIVLTEMEHHSNLVPWQQLAKRKNMKLKFIKINENFELNLEDALNKINEKTAIVSVCHVSNVLGTINPVEKIVSLAKKFNALTVVDAAQSIQHIEVDVKKIDCDFLAFSGHKMLGPMGIGVLYGKKETLKKMLPFMSGGGTIKKVTLKETEFANIPERFEAGTQNVAGAIGLAEAIRYIRKIGLKRIEKIDKELLIYALKKISKIKNIKVYNLSEKNRTAVISFNVKNVHPHDIASILNESNIAVRAGHHCAIPLMKSIKADHGGTVRASFYFYNTKEEVDKLVNALNRIAERFN